MLRLGEGREVVVICGYTDLRRGIDGLCRELKTKYELDPFADALYLFCGRKADRFKGLYWDHGKGFTLMYSRLESGHYQWPRTPAEAKNISGEQYRRLLEGLKIEEKSTINILERTDIL